MKLLVITQKVDKNDSLLGFFHRWIEEFAKHCEKLTVICLEKGESDLSAAVKILSLGKESGKSRLKYLWRFYKYIWQERNNYDSVFVHMNQEYVLLAGWWWRLTGKRVWLWRNHPNGNFWTKLAVLFSDRVFCTSPQSYTARFAKTKIMPAGIDTEFFKPATAISKKPNSLLFLGRIAPIKRVVEFIDALAQLQRLGVEFSATIAGGALPQDVEYEKLVRTKIGAAGLGAKVNLLGAVGKDQALQLYREHELYVNLTPVGSLDKTIFEAMASGTPAAVFNQEPDLVVIAKQLALHLAQKQGVDPRIFVLENHSLNLLMEKLKYEVPARQKSGSKSL